MFSKTKIKMYKNMKQKMLHIFTITVRGNAHACIRNLKQLNISLFLEEKPLDFICAS